MVRKGLALVVALAACGAAAAATSDPQTLVLRRSDLPAGYSVTATAYRTNRDEASGAAVIPIPAAKLTRWGRLTGYERTFERDNSSIGSNAGFLSNVSIYATTAGAKNAASYLFAKFPSRSQWQTFVPKTLAISGRLGDEARMYQLPTSQGIATMFVVWRSGRVQALLGLAGTNAVTPARALRYARIMDGRIQRVR